MVLQLPPLKNFTVVFIYRRGRKQEGAPPALAMVFFGGDPARTVKYHGFATTTSKISPLHFPVSMFVPIYIYTYVYLTTCMCIYIYKYMNV